MTPEEYRQSVLRSESPNFTGINERLLHAVLGIVTEAGELADVIKKEAFYGRKPNKWKLLEELGDLRWYQELLCDELDVMMEEVKEMNIKKLKERYPDQFDDVEVRDYEAEQRAAEVGAIGVVSPGVYIPRCFGSEVTGSACMSCPHKKECDTTYYNNHEDEEEDKSVDQSVSGVPDCFGQASKEKEDQKCFGCLSRGPCVRETLQHMPCVRETLQHMPPKEEERPVPECFSKYRSCSIYCTTVCDARTLCKAETPE